MLSLFVLKLSSTMTSKLPRTSDISGRVLAYTVAASISLVGSNNETAMRGVNRALSAVWSESIPIRVEPGLILYGASVWVAITLPWLSLSVAMMPLGTVGFS